MELFYLTVFGVLGALAAGLELTKPTDTTVIKNVDFRRFRNNYLVVYCLMMGALQVMCADNCVFPAPPRLPTTAPRGVISPHHLAATAQMH